MDDPRMNPPDQQLWPHATEAVSGWVLATELLQLGFTLLPSWTPPPELEREARRSTRVVATKMNLPPVLAWELMEWLRAGTITSVTIQTGTYGWLVAITLPGKGHELEKVDAFVDRLFALAGLSLGSAGRRINELSVISSDNPNFTEKDVLLRWLSNRVFAAIKKIIDDAKPSTA